MTSVTSARGSNHADALRGLVRAEIKRLSNRLDELSKRPWWKRWGPGDDPARSKFLASIVQLLRDLEQIMDEADVETLAGHQPTLDRVQSFIETEVSPDLYADEAWRVADALKMVLVPLLTGRRLRVILQEEAKEVDVQADLMPASADEVEGAKLKDARTAAWIRKAIQDLLSKSEVKGKSQGLDEEPARILLERLYRSEGHATLHERTVGRLQGHYLSKLSILLAVLVASLLVSLSLPAYNLAAALAGAAGGTLARALRIRAVLRITGLRATWFTAFAQAAIGAMLGLLTYWAFESKLVSVANWQPTAHGFALLAAAGGFVEPFSLGIIERAARVSGGASEGADRRD